MTLPENRSVFAAQISGCSSRTQTLLQESGWSVKRIVDIQEHIQSLTQASFTVFPIVKVFLANFADLHLRWTSFDPRSRKELYADIIFDPIKALESIDYYWFEDYQAFLNRNICPIGKAEHSHFTLMMDENGTIYSAYGKLLIYLGDTIGQAIDVLVMSKDVKVLRDDAGNKL